MSKTTVNANRKEATMLTRKAKHTASLALSAVLVLASFVMSAPAKSYHIETGPVVICDTQEQVERFVQAFDGNQELAINIVNVESHDPSACAVVDAAYVLGPQLGVARSGSHAFGITSVAVIGLTTPEGFRQVKPSLYFTPVSLKEFAV
jgi:hypothetical protein